MKLSIFKTFSLFIASMAVIGLSGCGSSGTTTEYGATGPGDTPTTLDFTVQIDQSNTTVAISTEGYITATAVFADGTTKDVTVSADTTWSSSDETVVTVDNTGTAKAVGVGTADITVTYFGESDTGTITVTNATLTSIAVSPFVRSTPIGISVSYHAQGLFSDNSTQDLTKLANWSSSDTTVANMDTKEKNTALALSPGTAIITATALSIPGTGTLTVTNATLNAIALTPSVETVSIGLDTTYIAKGTFSDSSVHVITKFVEWTSTDTDVVKMDANIARSIAVGNTTITAKYKLIISAPASLTVNDALLETLVISPTDKTIVDGTNQQMKAQATFDNNTDKDVTNFVSWVITDGHEFASIGRGGFVQSIAAGTITIQATASYNDVTKQDTTTLTINDAPIDRLEFRPSSMTLDKTQENSDIELLAIDTAGKAGNIESRAIYTYQNTNPLAIVVPIEGSNSIKIRAGVIAGTEVITATYRGKTTTLTVTIK